MLTDDEIRAVILACAHAPDGATEEDMGAAIRWAQGALTTSLMLDLVLEGQVAITMRDGEPVFSVREGRGEGAGIDDGRGGEPPRGRWVDE